MRATSTRFLPSAAAGLLALWVGAPLELGAAAAAPDPNAPEKPAVVEKLVGGAVEKLVSAIDKDATENLDQAHEQQAQQIGEFVEVLDRVFGETYAQDRERKVQVGVGLATTFNNHGNSFGTQVNVALRIPLPALERKFNAFIDIGGDVDKLGDVSNPNFSGSEKVYSLAGALISRLREDLEAGIRLKLLSSGSAASLNPFLRYERRVGKVRHFLEEQVGWDSNNDWKSVTELDVDRAFGSTALIRLRNLLDYTFGDPGAKLAHGLIVRRGVLDASGLSLEFWLEYNTAPDDPATISDDTIFYGQVRFRGRVWRKWLEYELRPAYTFPIDTSRSSFFSLMVSLTVLWDSYIGGNGVAAAPVPVAAAGR